MHTYYTVTVNARLNIFEMCEKVAPTATRRSWLQILVGTTFLHSNRLPN